MAVIKPGPTISRIAGAAGSKVYSSWKGRAVLCSKSSNRSNPSSPRQSTARAGATALSKSWSEDLTDTQRALWDEAAQAGTPADDPASSREQGSRVVIPQPKPVLSGYDAFIRANQRAIMTGIRDIGNPVLTPGRAFPCAPTNLIRDEAPPIPVNYALDFDGVNEDVLLGNVLNYEYNQPQAWELWMNVINTALSQQLLSKMHLVSFDGYEISIFNNRFRWNIQRASAGEGLYVDRAFSTTGVWVHGVVTYNGNNLITGLEIYLDTVPGHGPINNTPMTGTIITPANLTLASRDGSPGSLYAGEVGLVRNYNRNLVQADVNTLFAGGAGVYGPDPLGDGSCQGSWPLCSGAGNTAFDISGNNYHGTLRNMEPGDWVPGKVPCPDIPGPKQLEWDDPADLPVGGKIRIWVLSYDAHVHKQHVATIDRGVECWIPDFVRIAQGASVPINSMPGHYLFQIDAISPNGNQSPPSNTIEAVCPLV